jgi:short-subunit dehydrogenase
VGFGSVAAVRGRSRNVAYSASKRALQSLFESLRHAEESHGIAVTFYCLGYMNTSMAYGQRLPFPPISPASVAERVVRRLGRDTGTRFVPRYWRWVAMVLRALPWWIFGRLRF